MNEGNYSVYKHTSPSGKCYIGISCNPVRRWCNGKGYKYNNHFQNAINKYGWDNFAHEILYEGLTVDEARKLEIELISKYNATDRKYGYNIREGGDGSLSEESRRKISKSRMGQISPMKGRHRSDEMKKRIFETLKEYFKTHTNPMLGVKRLSGGESPCAKPVCIVDENDNVLKVYGSISEASEDTGCYRSCIGACCRGEIFTTKGFIWRYYNAKDGSAYPITKRDCNDLLCTIDKRKKPVPPVMFGVDNPRSIPIVEIDSDGRILSTYETITQAARELNLDISSVAKCCKGKVKTVKGHMFKYLSDIDQPQADFLIA